MRRDATKAIILPVLLWGLAGCGQGNQYIAPPPPKVVVATPTQKPVTRYLEVTGNAAAVNSADLVARVPGFVETINYQDGALVKKGTLLFTVEPESYKIKFDQAKAAETGSEASLNQAKSAFERQQELLASKTTTQALYDQALATYVAAQSNLTQAKSNTALAKLNYDYTQVSAPFDGIVTARQVSVGQYVGGGGAPTVLATIVQLDPIYVNFSISEQDVLRVRTEMTRLGITPDELRKVPVEIGLQSETGYPHKGTLNYAAPSVNQSTGTLPARAIFDNANRTLLPGYFVRVRVPLSQTQDALLVPDIALGSDQGGRYVLVVNKDNVVEQKKVETGEVVDTMRVIEKGLAAGDRIIVSGQLRAIPGQKVDPQTETAAAAAR